MKLKRAAALFLCLCLCFSMTTIASASDMVLELDTPDTLPKVGETFTAKVSLSGNVGFGALRMKLRYDESVIKCLTIELGEVLDDMTTDVNGKVDGEVLISAIDTKAATGNGLVVSAEFSVLAEGDPNLRLAGVNAVKVGGEAITMTVLPFAEEEPIVRPNLEFSDVPVDYWAARDISRAAYKGFVQGYDDGTFHPTEMVTRAQFVTMLWRIAGSPDAEAKSTFTDVPENSWFAKAVAWAAEKEYVGGVGNNKFDPNGSITREQAMAILFRCSGSQRGMEAMLGVFYDAQYTDAKNISRWAKDAVYWAIYNGLVTGVTQTTLVPGGTATRAEIAVILLRYVDNIK